jgi:hypothetical protein
MNPLIAYARIAASFRNFYGRHANKADTKVVVAFAMSGLFINAWTILLCISLVDRDSLARSEFSAVQFALFYLGVLLAEFIAVHWVERKIARDRAFFARVGKAPPRIAVTYLFVSVALLAIATAVVLASDWR